MFILVVRSVKRFAVLVLAALSLNIEATEAGENFKPILREVKI